ncbi:MAG: elongation factor Ts [Chloroflexi bacterium]|nr:elongation factor Ts [Chloroflexota bacterium]
MEITVEMVKELRERSGAGVMDCKRALQEARGDLATAEESLKARGLALAQKKAGRETGQGLIVSYIHPGGRVGALVEVNCETDFVARTQDFQDLAHDLAMQVAAMAPLYVNAEDIPGHHSGMDSKQVCLMLQPFIKDPGRTVADRVTEVIAKVGENIRVRRFARFERGSEGEGDGSPQV